jgi:uncharacterized membrane protein (UPF0127 family)
MIKNKTKKNVVIEKAELADSVWKQARGLMFRSKLARDCGMLFRFGRDDFHGIWMLFMRLPIDIIFVDADKRVIAVYEDARPLGFNPKTWKVYYPEIPAKYVLEVGSGVAKEKNVEIGDFLEF